MNFTSIATEFLKNDPELGSIIARTVAQRAIAPYVKAGTITAAEADTLADAAGVLAKVAVKDPALVARLAALANT